MVVVPLLDKGLMGKEVALKMIDPWAPFGIPSIVKTDQGSHFTAAWWTTMCANLGFTRPTHKHTIMPRTAELNGQDNR